MTTKDLSKGVSYVEKDNYFLVTIEDLNPDTIYPLQFRWKFKDGTTGPDWSAVYKVTTQEEQSSDLPIPYFTSTNVTSLPGMIRVTWNGNDINEDPINMSKVDHIGIFIEDQANTFGLSEAGSFKVNGGLLIPLKTGTYTVKLASVSASGKVGTKTSGVEVEVQGGFPIDKPTLPVGLSVAAAPFAITANWTGEYSNNETFGGFKAINIYASTTDLGSSTTTTSLSNKLVGSMTVDSTANKITIGMEVLKQTLSLTSAQLYASSLFFYQVAVNANGLPYQVNNVTTYTRINETGIAPSKANLINLEEGIISIENLTAGNGQFQSWLRTGDAPGSRIELSSANVDPSEAGGYQVLSGLTVYNSDNDPVFRADLSGNVAFGGYTPQDIASISTTATTASTNAGLADGKATQAQLDAYAANQQAITAAAAAATAFAKTSHFNSDGSEIILGIKMPTGQGSIYSNKATYGSTNAGWFIGNKITQVNGQDIVTPVIDVGDIENGNSGFRWTGSELQVSGNITASSGAITGNLSVGNVIIKPQGVDGGFAITDENGLQLMYAPTAAGRMYLGDPVDGDDTVGRQVAVARSAQIAGGTANANSGGLRNMFTATETLYANNPNIYLTANSANGDVLLVYSTG